MRKIGVDWAIVLPILFLAGFSLVIVFSLSPSLFPSQFLFFLLGFLIFLLLSFLDLENFLKEFALPFYILSIIFLALVFFGPKIRGAQRWIEILGLRMQPSELVKPFLITSFAQMISFLPPRKTKNFFLHLFLISIPFFLVFKQPDLGNALLYLGTWLVMIFASGFNLVFGFWFLILGFLATPLFWHFLKDYQRLRVLSFLNPRKFSQTASYHSIQAKITVGAGRVFGKGLGRGTQSHLKFLPEYYTDFIFASLCEELGFLGGGLILIFYLFLLWQILKVGAESRSSFSYLFSIGVFGQLLLEIFINVGMNLGLVPITGITLPLISYGGSSIVSTLTTLGIIASLKKKKRPEMLVIS